MRRDVQLRARGGGASPGMSAACACGKGVIFHSGANRHRYGRNRSPCRERKNACASGMRPILQASGGHRTRLVI